MDFTLDIKHDGDINILQITDMQLIDASQRRYPDRIDGWKLTEWLPEKNDVNIYDHIRYLVNETKPDLILITGDIIYGEFDDAGTSFIEFANFMDSFEIPWAPIFGNHDNESKKGVNWQCEQFENAKYALFKRGNVFGHGNYSIGISQNGTLDRVIFMMDSNGCNSTEEGFRDDQIEWFSSESKKLHEIDPDLPLFLCCHIQTMDFINAFVAKGYMEKPDEGWEVFSTFEIGDGYNELNGDFGRKHERISYSPKSIMPILKECKVDGFFVGHCHQTNTSILYEGIRFTFGLKTGYYDYHEKEAIGGTLIKLTGRNFSVKHVYYRPEST